MKTKKFIIVIAIPLLFGLIMRFLFGIDNLNSLYSVMSVSFILLVPFAIGVLTIYFSSIEKVRRLGYRIFMPWVPILGLLVLTIALQIEGWGCWVMIMPVFLLAATIAGLTAGHFKLKKDRNENSYVSILVLLPFFMSPIEQMIGSIPGRYEAYTYIDIHAKRADIWNNVTRVKPIKQGAGQGLDDPNFEVPKADTGRVEL